MQRYEHSAAIDFTKPISSGNAQAVVASGKFTSPLSFSPPFFPLFFSISFLNRHLLPREPRNPLFARRSSSLPRVIAEIPALKRASKKAVRGKVTNGHTRKHWIAVIARKTYRMFASPNSLTYPPHSSLHEVFPLLVDAVPDTCRQVQRDERSGREITSNC